jgi:hypothetical protein
VVYLLLYPFVHVILWFLFIGTETDIAALPTSYQNDFRYLYNHKLFADITFIIDGQKVTAHKCVLAARCEKFRYIYSFVSVTSSITHEIQSHAAELI